MTMGHDRTFTYLNVWRWIDGRWVRQECPYCAQARARTLADVPQSAQEASS